jgi:hypothetical protein
LLLAATAAADPPSLSVAATDAVIGQTIHATVQLSESPSASGEISFEVFGPEDPSCSGPALTPSPASAPVSGEGEYSSGEFSPPEPGIYHWSVHYLGEPEDADAICSAASTVSKASPELAATASAGLVGTAIHDEATLTGGLSPTGEVIFSVYGPADTSCLTPLETDAEPIEGGQATSADFTPQQAGEFRWTAAYSGDANNEAAGLGCNAANQSSNVEKASPTLTGTATSAVVVGSQITDSVTLAAGFQPSGQILFRAYGPGDATCTGAVKYEATLLVNGNGAYSPTGFSPPAGLYRWTAAYSGDANNEAAGLGCNAANQSSAVGKVAVTLATSATSGTIGDPLSATASIENGAIPAGQITFTAFSPGDENCSGAPAFSSTVSVTGNGSYRSAAFVPTLVGTFRWTVSYSGDANHTATADGCGKARSSISQAKPSISSGVEGRLAVGKPFWVTATLQGGFAPAGTISFQIYDPAAAGCAKPLAVNTVAVAGNGTVRSDPFVPLRPGRYSFVARYSGDAANQGASELCDPSRHAAQVEKRTPKVKPHARLIGGKRISIRAQLSGAASPSGVINFRLFRPTDARCKGKPVFSGGLTVRSNGSYVLAQYLASKSGIYRLSVGYSGDQRNRRYTTSCRGAQSIRVG